MKFCERAATKNV